ncbi:MAG TPA: nitroreductase family deazaflavin-dependent oxidoreductase [Actinobacteria bacterium]|nr:deazaflavin-dependent nitroreductase [bacterium BMS3Bbin02]HDL41829.1 nitroreductase family deazaflavin-dependent oxidoreductase [Actinomycetota bacterium]
MKDSTAKRLSTLHTVLFRVTSGRIGKRLVNNDMLLLSTIGSETGKQHTVPLLYLRDGDDFVIIASWGGRPENPQWYRNLQAKPHTTIQVLGEKIPVTARTADETERARLWPSVLAAYEGYAEYQSRTTREIPVVILSRR